ncbi:MAG: leucine-rich repeat domain-containing protein, partial [Clostridiales bacterium]|nr:leucine-rich repeat domain-containing protein [Clostridiales bacterium]
GKTVIQDTLYDQDSCLFFLEAGAKPLAHTFPSSKPVGSSRLLPISPVNPVIFHEPNVCILDLAEYRFDEEPWMEEDEILRIDNLFRRKLGYPLRTQALAQPWTTPHNSSYEHMLSLRFSIDSEIELKHALLALENDEKTTILLDGKEIKNEKTGWYTDRSIQTVALPLLTKGPHTLEFHIPYHARENIEPFYLLGDFTVASGTVPEFTWYKDDVTTCDLPTGETVLGETAPKELGTYTLVVNAAGAENNGIVYTAAELRVLVEIKKVPLAGTVTLEGMLKCNETVTVNKDGITHPHPGALSYKWYRVDGENESVIDGATGESYELTTEDIGKKIKVVVSAAYCDGTLEATTDTFVDKLQGTATITSTSGQLSKDWDGETIATPLVDTTNDTGESNENVIFEYKKSTEEAYTQTAPTDAGTYDVRVRVKEDAIYHEAVSEPVTYTIAKVDATVKNAPIAAKNLTYDQGKNITLINAENASVTGGELQYAFSENGTYSTSLPNVTEAGTYSVYYKVVGDRNHNDTEPVKINVTVRKAVPSYQVPTDISAVCGAKLLAVKLPTGFQWTDEDVTLEAGDTATGIQIIKKAKYVPEDTTNYEEVPDIAITIQVTHDSEVKGVVEPTCTEKGYTGNTCCKHCGTKLQSGTDIAALGHDFAKDFTVDTEATCKSVGSKSRHCIRCEEKTEITEIPKSDHAWDDGKITKEATVTEEGVKTYSCKKCDATKTETIPKKDAVTTQPSKDTTMTQPPKEEPIQQQSTEELTVSQPAKNGDVITDNKSDATYEVTDTVKKEVTYNAPIDGKAKDITIPETVVINGETYKITHIDENAFKGNKTVTTVTIGSNIQSIGKNAFKGCKRLKTIIIQSQKLNMKKISKKAFKGISKKTVIKVPKKKLAAYRKLLKKKGLSSKNRIKGY